MRYSIEHIKNLARCALLRKNFPEDDANIIIEQLIFAELRGNSQGLIKLVSGALKHSEDAGDITIKREAKTTARLDGGHRIGMAVLQRMTDMAIHKARDHGVAVICASNYASATGALGLWCRKLADAGFVSIVMSQCPEMVAPHGSCEAIFGTNPIAIGVPHSPRHLILDMATSADAWFSLVSAAAEGRSIRDDIAYDMDGRPTVSPVDAMKGALRSFDRSYKGSHLGLMVELLAGAMSGASMEENKKDSRNWGSVMIAIDPAEFGTLDDFQKSVATMCARVKNARKLPGTEEVFLPGERGDILEAHNLSLGTIELSEELVAKLSECGRA